MNLVKFEFYVPETHLNEIKDAVFTAGAGTIGDYDCCCWETAGTGQFRPCAGSDPYLGEEGRIEFVTEIKVEMVCKEELIDKVIKVLKKTHPYETPAYQYWAIKT